MNKNRTAARKDNNEPGIVKKLRQIPGVSVETEKDDILVGCQNFTFWYELKNPEGSANKKGKVFDSRVEPDQKRILNTFTGHYEIVTTFEQIIADMNKYIPRKIKLN